MYDLKQLRVLHEVAKRGSFSAAADALDYTQSAVSKQIAALEREAGAVLVERAVRPVRLTDAGGVLLSHAQAALSHLSAAEQELAAIAGLRAGSLRLGTFASAGATLVVPAISAFHARHPDVKLSLIEADPRESISLIRAGELDLAVVHDYPALSAPVDEHLEQTHLLEDRFELVLPNDHPLTRKRSVTLAALAGERWLFPRITGGVSSTYDRLMRGACAVAGFEPQILFEINDCQAAQGFVAADMGIAVLPHLALYPLNPNVVVRKLNDAPSRSVLAIRLAGSTPTPAAQTALQLLQQAAHHASP
ncbi:MAG TPA: LysR substrate-binding domain-containing protein [Solirubrobacteraceae bacterium]|nr:LysR substrate-binding domain-containing protein [Solirubrobacteraceae bacterium]